jgi:hypothetical protein
LACSGAATHCDDLLDPKEATLELAFKVVRVPLK